MVGIWGSDQERGDHGVQVRDGHDEVERIAGESSGRLVAAVARPARDLAAVLVQSERAGDAFELTTLPMMREYVERQRDVCV